MPRGVLLIVNCALDSSYRNRQLLRAMYSGLFDELVFTVSSTCPPDPQFPTVVQRWDPPPGAPCICTNLELGDHSALRHSFHPRLIAAAEVAAKFESLVFTEDDCVLSPHCDADWATGRCRDWDAICPPIQPCRREDTGWLWTQHAAGYPAFLAVADRLDHRRLAANWASYRNSAPPLPSPPLMFCGFCDWFVISGRLLQPLTRDLLILREVWHEAAIPTALLHNTSRIGVSTGLPLWGSDRDQPLSQLMNLLDRHDFVHAIKLSQYPPDAVLKAYRAVGCGASAPMRP